MTHIIIIIGLTLAVLYSAKRWTSCKAENTDLKNQIALLKRQLTRSRRTG